MDENEYIRVKEKFFINGQWDREGVKNTLALPCYNRADALDVAEVFEEHIAVQSKIGEATELISYSSGQYTTGLRPKLMKGGGIQLSPDSTKLKEVENLW